MTNMAIRDTSLFVQVVGEGHPLLLMHGGPGLDHTSLLPLKPCADQFTMIFYDHRCNGRSNGSTVTTMTWDNLTADADALRQKLGFDRWAVLGHSFGGMVALEYALRYPARLSHLILMDTGGEIGPMQRAAPEILARRGFSADAVQAVRRFFTGQMTPREVLPLSLKFATAYYFNSSLRTFIHDMVAGHDLKARPEASVFGFKHLCPNWTVMDRLSEIQVPALVMTGREDFLFPPEHLVALAAGLPDAKLEVIERAGHETPREQPCQVIRAIRDFMTSATPKPSPQQARADGNQPTAHA